MSTSKRRFVVSEPAPIMKPPRIVYTIQQLFQISQNPLCAPNSSAELKARNAVPLPVKKL